MDNILPSLYKGAIFKVIKWNKLVIRFRLASIILNYIASAKISSRSVAKVKSIRIDTDIIGLPYTAYASASSNGKGRKDYW